MTLFQLLNDELTLFRAYDLQRKLFHLTFFTWIFSLPAKNTFYQVTVILIPLFFVVNVILDKKFKATYFFFNKYRDITLGLSCILMAMCISNILSEHADIHSWITFIKFTERYILLFYSLLFLYEKKFFTLNIIAIFIISTFSVYALHGIYQTISSGGTQDALSIVYNRNPYALVMMTGAMVTSLSLLYLSSILPANNRQVLLLIPFLLFFLLALIYCRSRSGWISTGIFFVGLLLTNKELFFKYKFSFLIGGILMLSIFIFDDRIAARLANLLHDKPREEIWAHMISLIKNHPYFGYGLVEFKTLTGGKYYFGTHNSILEILLYTGAYGIIAYSVPFAITIKEILRQKSYNLLPALLAFTVLAQFNLSVFGNKTFLSIITLFIFIIFSSRADVNDSRT